MKIKKWYFVIGAIVALVVLLITLSFTAFSLKGVSLDFRTSHANISQITTDNEIIASGKFKKGKPIFFHNKKQYSKNIESSNPYIKVINIETIFPSKLVVHIAERQEVYAIKGWKNDEEGVKQNCFYICDDELRVLRIEGIEEYLSTSANSILLENKQLENGLLKEYNEGEFIYETRRPTIYNALYENNRDFAEQKAMIEGISLSKQNDEILKKDITTTELKMFSGQTFIILNDNSSMKYKAKLMLDVFSQIHEFDGKEYKLGERTEDGIKYGYFVKLTSDYLADCRVIISNYYNYKEEFGGGYKDCYFKFDLSLENAQENGLEVEERVIKN